MPRRRTPNRRQWRLATVSTALVLTLSGGACTDDGPPRPSSPPLVRVTLSEYRVELSGAPREGRVRFDLVNVGRENHGISLYSLPEDFPPINEQLQGATRRVLQSTIASIYDFPPGRADTFAIDFQPGRYAMVCFERSPDGIPHSRKGMAIEFRVE